MNNKKKTESKQDLAKIQQLLIPTLTMLDAKGTDTTVSKALIISYEAIKSIQKGEIIEPANLYKRAMRILNQGAN